MSAAAITLLLQLALQLEPPVAAGIVALIHSIHKKKSPVQAVSKAQAAVDAEPSSTDLEN